VVELSVGCVEIRALRYRLHVGDAEELRLRVARPIDLLPDEVEQEFARADARADTDAPRVVLDAAADRQFGVGHAVARGHAKVAEAIPDAGAVLVERSVSRPLSNSRD